MTSLLSPCTRLRRRTERCWRIVSPWPRDNGPKCASEGAHPTALQSFSDQEVNRDQQSHSVLWANVMPSALKLGVRPIRWHSWQCCRRNKANQAQVIQVNIMRSHTFACACWHLLDQVWYMLHVDPFTSWQSWERPTPACSTWPLPGVTWSLLTKALNYISTDWTAKKRTVSEYMRIWWDILWHERFPKSPESNHV